MKCPECGFDCLPDDVECLACGIHIAAAVENKEKERIRSIEAAERKAKYEHAFKKELGLIPDDEQYGVTKERTPGPDKVTVKVPTCPKCGFEKKAGLTECLRCGVVFDKLSNHQHGDRDRLQTPVPPAPGPPVCPEDTCQDEASMEKPEDKTSEIDLSELKPLAPEGVEPCPPDAEWTDMTSVAQTMSTGSPVVEKAQADRADSDADDVDDADMQNLSMERDTPPSEQTAVEPTETMAGHAPVALAPVIETASDPLFRADEKTEIIQTKRPVRKTSVPLVRPSWFSSFHKKNTLLFEKSRGFITLAVGRGRDQAARLLENKAKSTRMLIALAVMIVLAVTIPLGLSAYKNAKIERLKRQHAEKLEKIRVDFVANQDAIADKINRMISSKLFDSAEKEIAQYDIPALHDELVPLKNHLKEIRLYEKARMIPAVEFERNYQAFSDLSELNPSSRLYTGKMEFYKQKLAGSEFSIAEAYLKGKNKNLSDMNKAVIAIDRALDLYPFSKKFSMLKRKLLTEKLLFYEGNDNIVMAVQDDGMGKKLYSDQRKLTIWLKNISQDTVYINVQFFTMLGQDKKSYTYNDIGRRFKTKLLPGEQTRGELYFRTRTSPSKITFSHLISGEISRVFPD